MLDVDLAEIYGYETKNFNRQVKNNQQKFEGDDFMFQLSDEEVEELSRCKNFTLNKGMGRGSNIKYNPYVFTEQGIAMLSGVLKSDVAIQVSIRLMNVFVAMRKTLATIAPLMSRLEMLEIRQLADRSRSEENQRRNEERFDTIFKAMDGGDFPPQKVFFEGKHYDAYSFARKLIRKAKKSIVLVDNYCDNVTLDFQCIASQIQ